MAELTCGCQPGEFLCPEAVRLWNEVNRAYEAHDEAGYAQAMEKYYQHYGKEVPK